MTVTDYYYATFSVSGKTINATIHTESGFVSNLKQDAVNKIGTDCSSVPSGGSTNPPVSGGDGQENVNEQGALINCFDGGFRFTMTVKDSSGNVVATEYTDRYTTDSFSDGTSVSLGATVDSYGEYTVEIGVQAEEAQVPAPSVASTSS